jgi:hypothetical protein
MTPRPSDLGHLRNLKTALCSDLFRAWNDTSTQFRE